jgi:phosphatidylserine decarboxylase
MRFQTLWEARWIFAVELVLTAGFYWITPLLAILGLLIILYTFYFFRDPDRAAPADPDAVISAADGVISDIIEIDEAQVTQTRMKRVAIFLSVFDVHTNRAPIAGKVTYTQHYVGKYLDARNPEATRLNAYRTWGFCNDRVTVVVRQITGAIARRIVAWSKVGDTVTQGERFGMIRFGSRTEVYVPLDAEILVKVGDRVHGGLTVIARLGKP